MKINRGNLQSNVEFLQKTGLMDSSKRILEIGSGTGHLVKHFQDLGIEIIGSDINDKYLSFAEKQFGVKLKKINGEKLPFANDSFEIVISFDVFEHIANTRSHLQEVYRVLVPEGYYLLQTPNKLTNIPFSIIKDKSLIQYKESHCSLHTYWELKRRFAEHHFSVKFKSVKVVNEYFAEKVKRHLGLVGELTIKIINPDRLPIPLKTNFYVIAQKK